jgi:hypothetical protein
MNQHFCEDFLQSLQQQKKSVARVTKKWNTADWFLHHNNATDHYVRKFPSNNDISMIQR